MVKRVPKAAERDTVRQLYDSMAGTYDDIESEPFYANQYRVYERHLKRHLPAGGMVLDLGCGTGIQSQLLARSNCGVFGIDLAVELLRRAVAKCEGLPNCHFLQTDVARLPFANATFDAVISYGEVLSHTPEYMSAFTEVGRVLRPGGLFLFSVLNKWNLGLLYDRGEGLRALRSRGGHWRIWECADDRGGPTRLPLKTFTRREVLHLARRSGLVVRAEEGIHVSSLLVPLAWQRSGASWWARAYRRLGELDLRLARLRPWINLGYTCVYTAFRRADQPLLRRGDGR